MNHTWLKGFLAQRGYKVVRWPVPATKAAMPSVDGVQPHFPVGRVGPWQIPDDLRARTETWAKVLVSVYEQNASWPASIVPEGGMLLHALVRNIQPRVIVETGTCLGVSTLWMAAALKLGSGGKIITFDDYREPPDERLAASALFQNRLAGVRARLAEAGLSNHADVRVGDCAAALRSAHDELRSLGGVQMAFIDADHSPRGTIEDFRAVEPVLAVGGYVIVHDVFPDVANHLGPRVLVDEIARLAVGKYQACDVYTAQTNYGMSMLRRIG